jgi:glycosyltransferase involved in cell wall biosynthesis
MQCLAAQTRQPDEVIVSDDHSPNDPTAVVEKWSKHFPVLRYNRNSRNLHMPGNLNTVVGLATGEYIANLHDVDEWDSTFLEKWEKALDTYPSVGFVFCGFRAIGDWPCELFLPDVAPMTPGREFFEKHMLHKYGSIVWGTAMARRTAYDQLLPFDPAYDVVSDVDMWMRMCLHFDVAYVREPLMLLDYSVKTHHRLSRQFSWHRVETVWKIQRANIHRFYADDLMRLRNELGRHRRALDKFYLRLLLGRCYHAEWALLREGIASWQNMRLTVYARYLSGIRINP